MKTHEHSPEVTAKVLALYGYDPAKGCLYNRRTGKSVGATVGKGQRYVHIHFSLNGRFVNLVAHRVVWLLCKGSWPSGEIDHIDGNGYNNHIENLRCCTHSENDWNRVWQFRENRKTGVPGVSKTPNKNSYRVNILGKIHYGYDPFQIFYLLIQTGRRYA